MSAKAKKGTTNKSIFKQFKTDENLECGAGVILNYGDIGWVKIHRAGGSNENFQRLAQQRLKPYQRRLTHGTMPEGEARKVMIGIYADSVIQDWCIYGDDGEPIPFTREKVVEVFTELPEFFTEIMNAAREVELFRAEQVEADEGN